MTRAFVVYKVAGVRGKVMKTQIDVISGVLSGCATHRRIFGEAKQYEYEICNMDKIISVGRLSRIRSWQ